MQQSKNSFQRRPRRPVRNRAAEIFTISILVSLFLLLGMGAMFWVVQNRIAFVPTPTLTATPEPALTPTPNVPATLIMEDMLTQVAYTAAQATLAFQMVDGGQTATAIAIAQANGQPNSPLDAPTNAVFVPNVSGGGEAPVNSGATVDAVQLTATAIVTNSVFVPNISAPQATDTPVPPTLTNLPGIVPVDTATETATLLPFPTETATLVPPTPTTTATPTIAFVINNQSGQVVGEAAPLYPGIGTAYIAATKLPTNTIVNISGRSETGEWLFVCCYNNISYWTRNYYVRAKNNPTPSNAPTGVSGDDIRWLPVALSPANLSPSATVVPPLPGPEEYPQFMRDLRNSGRVPSLPTNYNPPVNLPGSQSGGAYVAPLVIYNNTVYAISTDNHLYAIDKQAGNQRWRYDLGEPVRQSPFVINSNIYLATVGGNVIALADQVNAATQIWKQKVSETTLEPTTGIKVVGDKLFLGTKDDAGAYLYRLDLNNPTAQQRFQYVGSMIQTPIIAGNLVLVAGSWLDAYDIDNFSTDKSIHNPWHKDLNGDGFLTPEVYVSPGLKALAELFVVDATGLINVINPNTGEPLMNPIQGADNAKLLTVTDSYIVTIGGGSVRRFNRTDGGRLGDIGIDGSEPMLASSSGNRLLVVNANGAITLIDLVSGGITPVGQQVVPMQAAPAISGLDLYIPGSDSFIYVLRGIQ